jgi:hypothetical protein
MSAKTATSQTATPQTATPQTAPHRKTAAKSSSKSAGSLTREALAGDIAAFRKAGGHIEVLGHTPFRTAAPRSAPKATGTSAPNAPAAQKSGN